MCQGEQPPHGGPPFVHADEPSSKEVPEAERLPHGDPAAVQRVQPGSKGSWRLIWCHERCHKSESENQRRLIQERVQAHGGALIALKKARQVGGWAERFVRPRFVLVTDWREAQPCWHELARHAHKNRPDLFVVLCNSRRQFSRATAWKETLGPQLAEVHVCEDHSIPEALLGGLIASCFSTYRDDDAVSEHEAPQATQVRSLGAAFGADDGGVFPFVPVHRVPQLASSSPTGPRTLGDVQYVRGPFLWMSSSRGKLAALYSTHDSGSSAEGGSTAAPSRDWSPCRDDWRANDLTIYG